MADSTAATPTVPPDITGLQDGFRGELLRSGDPGYEDARKVWNESISRFPALSAHVLVGNDEDCHERRRELEKAIYREFGIVHTTLQVDHVGDHAAEDKRIQFLPQIRKREVH